MSRYVVFVAPELLSDELTRRAVVQHVVARAAMHGVVGRVVFRKYDPVDGLGLIYGGPQLPPQYSIEIVRRIRDVQLPIESERVP